ncbi:MAG: Asp23/Gls24 family envelope stress response protein [Lachnospiraceae bacterium]|nr:Asp23/Gls24 family envelope stress response protein [Lachnospiraceae bacterium]
MEENYAVCDEAMGDVRISDEVVANIAVIAAGEIEGVSYVIGESKPNEFKNIVGIKNYSKDLRVEVCDRIVSVDMAIAVKYGFSLPAVGKAVQERVRTSIESMTGLEVSDINIRIACVDLK